MKWFQNAQIIWNLVVRRNEGAANLSIWWHTFEFAACQGYSQQSGSALQSWYFEWFTQICEYKIGSFSEHDYGH